MFTILQLNPYPQKASLYHKWKLKHTVPFIKKILLPSGNFYYYVSATFNKAGKIQEEYISNQIGNAMKNIILSEECFDVELNSFQLLQPKIYPEILFLNTMKNYIKEHKSMFSQVKLGFVDPNEDFINDVFEFAPFIKEIIIYTKKANKYKLVVQQIFEKFGLTVQMKDNIKKLYLNCDVVINPYVRLGNGKMGAMYNLKENIMLYGDFPIDIPKPFINEYSEKVNPVLFLSAIYENCHVKEVAGLIYTQIKRRKAL